MSETQLQKKKLCLKLLFHEYVERSYSSQDI